MLSCGQKLHQGDMQKHKIIKSQSLEFTRVVQLSESPVKTLFQELFFKVLNISKDIAQRAFLSGTCGVRIYPYIYSEFPVLQVLSIAFPPSHVHLQKQSVPIFFTASHHAVVDYHVYRSYFNFLLSLRKHRSTRLASS